ncbi:hypothetical protein H04402_00602 [Clostridium botulinum H04402 065]|nr:hypothetical protein H04402_00602 [Clostridium botulinum H04402 065]
MLGLLGIVQTEFLYDAQDKSSGNMAIGQMSIGVETTGEF